MNIMTLNEMGLKLKESIKNKKRVLAIFSEDIYDQCYMQLETYGTRYKIDLEEKNRHQQIYDAINNAFDGAIIVSIDKTDPIHCRGSIDTCRGMFIILDYTSNAGQKWLRNFSK